MFYQRVPRLFAALALARGDGSYAKLLRQLARVDLLILDDWGPEPLIAEQQRDLLEIVEDRYSAGSLIITSRVPIDRWYEIVGNPTLADAILDRFIHNAQATYADWLATLPDGLRTSRMAEALEAMVHLDLTDLAECQPRAAMAATSRKADHVGDDRLTQTSPP